MKRHIIVCVQFLLMAATLSACASLPENLVKSPQVQLRNIQVVGLGFNNQTFLLSFDVANPNSFSIPVRNVAYGVRLDGHRFASGETASSFTIPASGESSFTISVELNLLQTAPQLLTIVRDGTRREIPYQLEGQFGVDVPLVPVVSYRSKGAIRLDVAPF